MKFAYLSSDFGVQPFGGVGNSVHLHEIVRALRGCGHAVEVFSSVAAPEGEQTDFHSVPLEGFPAAASRSIELETGLPAHLPVEWRRLVYAEYVQRTLLPRLEAFRPDALYERYSLFAYGGVELARKLGVPLLLEVNAPLSLEASRYRDLVLKRTAADLERRIFRAADAVLVVSSELERFARGLGVPAERVVVLPNGVDPERFTPDADGGAIRERYGLTGKRVIGFVGTLRPWHDLDTLLEALATVTARDDDVELLVVGEGPAGDRLRGLTDAAVTCTGAIEYDDVPACMAAMDVVVVPYSSEIDCYFSPLKLFEAMAMARPVVGARIGQVAELVGDGETGLLYEPGDARDLAEKLRRALDTANGGSKLGSTARAWVVGERTWGHNAREITRIARSLRERPGPG
jgi:glycosyltransferase involved in cell wall biosynthesis